MTVVERAAIVGTGTMGPGMGAVLERAGFDVALHDVSEEQLEKARPGVDLARSVLDRLEAQADGAGGGSLHFEPDLTAALDGVDLVVEAVPEKLELKQQVFADFETHVQPETILASNTSGIPITKIAADLDHPERVIGTHWSNPPHLIPMIEIIPGERTSQEVAPRTWCGGSATTPAR
jgi:3-hydroxyacyl-CoA dehydrogenase